MMHFLQTHVTMPHYTAPVSTYPYGIQMVPNANASVTVSSDWETQVPFKRATGPYLHHEPISQPARNLWGPQMCVPTQGRSPTLGQKVEVKRLHRPSGPMSSCLHLCSSDRDRTVGNRLQTQCGPFQTSRTTPNSPYMTHSHGRAGPSLLGLSSAFQGFPGTCQGSQVGYKASVMTMSSSHPLCSPGSLSQSHPSLNVQASSDLTHPQSNSPTPIHSSLTPGSQPQLHTTFSPLMPSGVYTSVSTTHSPSPQGSLRQNDLVGSRPTHHTHDLTHSVLGQAAGTDCIAPEYPPQAGTRAEMPDNDTEEAEDISNNPLTVEVEPLWGLEVTQPPR